MKKLLIIADGIVAKNFLDRVMAGRFELDILVISRGYGVGLGLVSDEASSDAAINGISGDRAGLKDGASEMAIYQTAPHCAMMRFDATSKSKLAAAIKDMEFEKVIVSMPSAAENIAVRENLAEICPKTEVDLLDFWGAQPPHKTRMIDAVQILGSRLIDFVPDVPVIADNIGLGQGEIMEVRVPVGSSFAYRRIGSIRKKRWKISMIYRNGEAIVAGASDVIMPEDTLLIVGEPKILQSVFRAIKKEPGQFPAPFGSTIFVPLDMQLLPPQIALKLAKSALFLHEKLKSKKVVIMVLNPREDGVFEEIKSLEADGVSVEVDYHRFSLNKEMLSRYDVGLILTDKKRFNRYLKLFIDAGVPVLKAGDGDIQNAINGVIIGSNSTAEELSSVAIDCCKQLGISMSFYHFGSGGSGGELDEFFSNYSKLFNKSVRIIDDGQNPILRLGHRRDLMQFAVLDGMQLGSKWGAIFGRDVGKLSFLLGRNWQMYVPIN